MQLSATARTQNLTSFAQDSFDVLVIGGGVTGAGVALDAVSRGYRVALVEKADFASGTSSKSTKLVHGGIRYLPNFDFSLVHEALVERRLLLQNAPFLVRPIGFVLPIYEGDRHPVGMPFTTPGGIGLSRLLDIGLWLYDILAGRHNIRRHRHLSRDEVLRLAPSLVPEGLKEGFIYYDAQTNDARLTVALLRTAARYGAAIANYAQVTSFIQEQGQVRGAHVRDTLTGREIALRARHVVNATGIYAEQVERLTEDTPQVHIEPSKGTHLILAREDLPIGDDAIVLPETEDKRLLFVVPWESRIIFGTTDTGTGDLDHPTATQEDIHYLLKYVNRYFSVSLGEENIVSTYAGYRPLVKTRNANAPTAKLSRSHTVISGPTGLVTVTGGKLTTYRRMAEETVDLLGKRDGTRAIHPTRILPLQGSAAWPVVQRDLQREGAHYGLSAETIGHLGYSYGAESYTILRILSTDESMAQRLIDELPYIRAEVLYACREEMALTPYDVLARRTSIILEDRQRGLGIVEEVAALMAQELGWNAQEQQRQVQAYRTLVENQLHAERTQHEQRQDIIQSMK